MSWRIYMNRNGMCILFLCDWVKKAFAVGKPLQEKSFLGTFWTQKVHERYMGHCPITPVTFYLDTSTLLSASAKGNPKHQGYIHFWIKATAFVIHATQAVPPTCQRNSWVACTGLRQTNTLFDSQKSIRPDWDFIFYWQGVQLHQV